MQDVSFWLVYVYMVRVCVVRMRCSGGCAADTALLTTPWRHALASSARA